MYIFELLVRFFQSKKYKKNIPDYIPDTNSQEFAIPEDCEHFFMPLDEDNDYFACKYCGKLIPNKQLKKIDEN